MLDVVKIQVPAPCVIDPIEEVITTVSSPTSLKVPELVAVSASLNVTVALLAATVGATLLTTKPTISLASLAIHAI